MKRSFQSALLAAVAVIGISGSAFAVSLDPYITETQFTYTVHNDSSSLYVWGFIISHQPGESGDTTQANWTRADIGGSCLGSSTTCFFFHSNTSIEDTTYDIGPGTASSAFFHALFASDYFIMTTDINGANEQDFRGSTDSVSATPLPAALSLMGSALGAGYLLSRRKKSRRLHADRASFAAID